MTRFFGPIGYAKSVRSNGIVEEVITEHQRYGDELRAQRDFREGDSILGEVSQRTRISILADAETLENYQDIRYVVKGGVAWTVDSVQPERPRLILTLGDRYEGPRPEVSDE